GVLTAGAINTGLMTAASAASLADAADALDPLSALVHMKENGCGSTLDSIKYKIFPVTPETKCYPDFKINASNIQFLNMDKDELRAAIQEAPEICDFIYWNHKKLYPSVKATCGPEGATARFNDGS